ncbi:MAG: glycosyltransferase family 4 protein [Nanoarchaeota archaeon]
MDNNITTALFMSTYPPRECGIATFTRDLTNAIDEQHKGKVETRILALNDNGSEYEYSNKVKYQVRASDYDDWLTIAAKINKDDSIKAISIQHEFGIFGGENSCHPLPFLDKINKPVVVTFHSVFPTPQEEVLYQIRALAKRVQGFVVMTNKAVELLRKDYGIKIPIHVIPHGIPEVNFENQSLYKQKFNLADRMVLSSFGLVGPGKGYEHVIDSMPKVVKRFPDVLYLIVGATHPGVLEEEGETYRESLIKRAKKLGIADHVGFVNRYVSLQDLISYLKATDLYVSSGQNPEQITSGTLAYAMGCGRAIVSTPFPHAVDIVKGGNGLIVDDFEDPEGYSKAINELLSNPGRMKEIEENNYDYTRQMLWRNVAAEYGKVFEDLIKPQTRTPMFSIRPQFYS